MRFLTLTIKDDETVKSYDFANGVGDMSPLDVLDGLEFGLFGNDALFGGEIIISAEYEDKTYVISRDFAKGYASITENGEPLSPEKSQLLLANLAGLGWKQWRKNTEPTDYNAFLTDFSSYVTKYLSSLGFTAEELEWRSEAYDRKNDRILAQVEVLDELVDDTLEAKAEEKMKALHELDSELLSLSPVTKEGNGDTSDLSELEERLAALKSEEAEYADKAAALESSRNNSRNKEIIGRVAELKKEMEDLDAELNPLTADLDQKELLIADKKAAYEEAKKDFDKYDARSSALREEFFKMIKNQPDGAVTTAVIEKAESNKGEAYQEYNTWNEKFSALIKELSANHLDYVKRRSIREGVAFETAIEDMEKELSTLNEDAVKALRNIASIEEELRTTADKDGEDFFTLFKYKTLYEIYRSEISAEEKKIRDNEAARKKYASDIDTLKRAKLTLDLCVAQGEAKIAEFIDHITGIKARISFCADVDDMEYGDVCPVCNGRITDKADHAKELNDLNATLAELYRELEENRATLKDYVNKANNVALRLAEITEKDRITAIFIDSLNASVSRKQTEQTTMLRSVGAENFPSLERLCRNAAKSRGNGMEDLSHLDFLKSKITELTKEKEGYEEKAKELSAAIEDMRSAYNNEILPPIDGRRALSLLEETVANESREDELLSAIIEADAKRSISLSALLSGNLSAPSIVTATTSVFTEVGDEILQNDSLRKAALERMSKYDQEIKDLTDDFNEKIAKADALLAKIEGDKRCIAELNNLLTDTAVTADAVVFSEEEELALEKDVNNYYAKLRYIQERIAEVKASLPDEEFDEEKYLAKKKEAEDLAAELSDIEKRLATSAAAIDLACAKTEQCDALIKNSESVKMLADGDIADVIMPVLNDALYLSGEEITASAEGLGIKLSGQSKKGLRNLSYDEVDNNVLCTAIDCVINYVLRLATDKETMRFLPVEKRGPEAIAAAKYGVILL